MASRGDSSSRRGALIEPASPDLPGEFTAGELPGDDLVNGALHVGLAFDGTDLSGRESANADIDQCQYRNVNFSQVKLRRAEVRDCVFANCDLANLRARDCTMGRCTVSASRMTGWSWVGGGLRDVVFDDCRMDLASFAGSKLRYVLFRNCRLDQADFGEADLSTVRFSGCDLTGAVFSGATMTGTRISRCQLDGITGVTSLRGAVVASTDALALVTALAGALGIVIDDD